MNFENFLEYLPKIVNLPLPSKDSHLKMAPYERVKMLKLWDYSEFSPKMAGVMMLFYPKNSKANLVLIKRNAHGVHASQIAFPGGKFDAEDSILEVTATRETFEEVGVLQESIKIIKEFTPLYVPPSNFLMHPFLGVVDAEINFKPNADEVEEIIEVTLDELLSLKIESVTLTTSYAYQITVPAYMIQGNVVWGATAMILSELIDMFCLVITQE